MMKEIVILLNFNLDMTYNLYTNMSIVFIVLSSRYGAVCVFYLLASFLETTKYDNTFCIFDTIASNNKLLMYNIPPKIMWVTNN